MSERPDEIADDAERSESARPAARVVYRDAEEFKKALDAASESIAKSAGPDIVGHVVWWGLLALLAFIYTAQWTIGWDIRHELIPGFDLVKPVWVLIVGIFLLHMVETRNRHGAILRKRLCLKCGMSLQATAVDDAGDGVCPNCARAFNLGEYRRPEENRGRHFGGYLDADHFDKAIYGAAEQINTTRATGFEAELMGWLWIALGVAFGTAVVLDWDVLGFLPGWFPVYGAWFVAMFVWSWVYASRMKRLKPRIVDERLCMNCGFCLLGTPTDDDGFGRCPECGEGFVPGQYERPEAN